jgi:hypothetical protein
MQAGEDERKMKWLLEAAREGFEQVDRGECVSFRSVDELLGYTEQVGEEVSREIADERATGG